MSSLASGLAPAEGRAPWRRRWARAIRRAIIRRPDSSVSSRSAACDPWSGVLFILSARKAGWSHGSRGGPAGEYTARAAQTWPHSGSCAFSIGSEASGWNCLGGGSQANPPRYRPKVHGAGAGNYQQTRRVENTAIAAMVEPEALPLESPGDSYSRERPFGRTDSELGRLASPYWNPLPGRPRRDRANSLLADVQGGLEVAGGGGYAVGGCGG